MEGTLETVVFRDFVERGLTLSVSEFFYALLQFCKAFLGILPHFHLFQHFFTLVPISNSAKPTVVGGCELVLYPET